MRLDTWDVSSNSVCQATDITISVLESTDAVQSLADTHSATVLEYVTWCNCMQQKIALRYRDHSVSATSFDSSFLSQGDAMCRRSGLTCVSDDELVVIKVFLQQYKIALVTQEEGDMW